MASWPFYLLRKPDLFGTACIVSSCSLVHAESTLPVESPRQLIGRIVHAISKCVRCKLFNAQVESFRFCSQYELGANSPLLIIYMDPQPADVKPPLGNVKRHESSNLSLRDCDISVLMLNVYGNRSTPSSLVKPFTKTFYHEFNSGIVFSGQGSDLSQSFISLDYTNPFQVTSCRFANAELDEALPEGPRRDQRRNAIPCCYTIARQE